MKNTRRWILLGCIASLLAAFLGLDFRIAASNTTAKNHISTASIGEGLPNAMQRREKIKLRVAGEGPLVTALQDVLLSEISSAGVGESQLLQEKSSTVPRLVLVVKVENARVYWTPFFAASQLTVQTGYSSVGSTAFPGETPVILDNRAGLALQMVGEYSVGDSSWGLISRPGYYRLLAEAVAQQIVTALKDLYGVTASPLAPKLSVGKG